MMRNNSNSYNNNSYRGNESYRKNSSSKSNWVEDKKFEEESMNYLKNTEIFNDLNIREIVKDRNRQLKGIDIIGKYNGKDVNIDVKAIASKLPTFCFEIGGNMATNQIGWLINPDLKTDYYLIVYHDVEGAKNYKYGKSIIANGNTERIHETEALLINKEKLRNRINEEFEMSIEDVAKELRKVDVGDRKSVMLFDTHLNKTSRRGDIYPTISCGIKEQPINIVVRKEILKSLADKSWVIR